MYGFVADPDFFDVAAQVMPVFLLTLIFEGRFLPIAGVQRRWSKLALFLVRMMTLIVVCVGEVFALVAIADQATAEETFFTTLGLITGGYQLVQVLLRRELEEIKLILADSVYRAVSLIILFLPLALIIPLIAESGKL